jgi:hypothetical protein
VSLATGAEGSSVIRCDLTLEGSFHTRTFAKTRASLVGYVTRAAISRPCTGGEPQLLAESLPWHLRYDAFTGTLPRLTSVRFQMIGFSLWYTVFGVRCLYRSTTAEPLYVTWFRGEPFPEFPEFEIPPSVSLEGTLPETQGIPCLGQIRTQGRGRLTNLGSSTLVTINLI